MNAVVAPPFQPERGDDVSPSLDFEVLFRSAPSLLLVLAPDSRFTILEASDAYLRSRRASRESVLGRGFFEVFPEVPGNSFSTGAANLRGMLERVLATGRGDSLHTPIRDAGGRLRYIIHRLEAIELEVLRSAHERDEAFRKLEIAMQELEAFTYSASHDLRGPLSSIGGYCELLRELESVLPRAASNLISRIDANAKRMTTTLDALLELSRVDRTPVVRRSVDLTAIARRVVCDLREREPERRVVIRIAEGLKGTADERLVAIALENLLGNAWKYTRRTREATVEVGARKVVGRDVFFVRDNGAGFDMAEAGRLFTPFVRLHGTAEFEGHGIGLATVRRVVERHGGSIWAEAQRGRGAVFHFTLSGGEPIARNPPVFASIAADPVEPPGA